MSQPTEGKVANPSVKDGRTMGSNEIDRPDAAARATMDGDAKSRADPTRSIGEAVKVGKASSEVDRMIRAPEQNPPLNHPDFPPVQPLDDQHKEQAQYAGPQPTGADIEPHPSDHPSDPKIEGGMPTTVNAPLAGDAKPVSFEEQPASPA